MLSPQFPHLRYIDFPFSHRFPHCSPLRLLTFSQPYLKPNPRGLTSSQCWGRTCTCRCVQTVVAPGQTPGPTASGHQAGSSARHSSVPAGRGRVRGGWVEGPGALQVLHLPSPPGLPLLHSETSRATLRTSALSSKKPSQMAIDLFYEGRPQALFSWPHLV